MTCRTLEDFYHIDGRTFEKQYKEVLSGFRQWDQIDHADEWLLFPDNIGLSLAIDETSLSNGELYTFVTNRAARTREGSLVAVVAGTKSEDVIAVLDRIDEDKRSSVEEVTLDLSDSMRKIVKSSFPNAKRVIDRFHVQKLACDAYRSCASNIAGMPYSRQTTRWRKLNSATSHTNHTDTPTEIQERSFSPGQDTYSSSPLTNGLSGRNWVLKFFLNNIQTSKRHTDCATHCA